MSLAALMVRPVTVVHAGVRTDAYGDSQPDWTTAVEVATTGWLAQTSSIENRDGRDATVSTLTLTLPTGTVIGGRDRVRIDGVTYEVTDEPLKAWTPRGEHHIEALLELTSG